jgi:hypothetical protein
MAYVSFITLGVGDLDRATRFYEALGWRRSPASVDDEISFMVGGAVVLGLFGREALAEDAQVELEPSGRHGNVALASNVASEEAVDELLARAARAGGEITKPGQRVFWGGYSGYFRDLDGHLWEVAHNPGFELLDDGRIGLPDR